MDRQTVVQSYDSVIQREKQLIYATSCVSNALYWVKEARHGRTYTVIPLTWSSETDKIARPSSCCDSRLITGCMEKGRPAEKEQEGTFLDKASSYVLLGVIIMHIYAFVKVHQTIHSKCVHYVNYANCISIKLSLFFFFKGSFHQKQAGKFHRPDYLRMHLGLFLSSHVVSHLSWNFDCLQRVEIFLPDAAPVSQLVASTWCSWLDSFVLEFQTSSQLVCFLPEVVVQQCAAFLFKDKEKPERKT